ncbi:MAG: hypothetical protein WEB00_00740 [Dehalococcoidia bacterium]
MSRRLVLVSLLTGVLGLAAGFAIVLALDDEDAENAPQATAPTATPTPTPTPTPEPTPDPGERFVRRFATVGCELLDFGTKLNAWIAEVQERADRIEILGGIGFWREILDGVRPRIAELPAAERNLGKIAEDYIVAVDAYLAKLGEYWFTGRQEFNEQAAGQLAFAEAQRLLLEAEATSSAGGSFSLECPRSP